MAWLEANFHRRASMFFNPVVWAIRLYHLAFQLAYFAHSREREFAADQHVVKQIGKEEAAATLVLLETLDCLPVLRLANIAKDAAARQEPLDDIFGEQQRRALALAPMDWEDACRRALKRKTTPWSTHPALRDRLKAIGVSPKQAPALLTQRRIGTAACELFPAWAELERMMSDQWVCSMRIEQQLKLEAAQIFLGRQR
jgi:Zn-dependent protease with chaperone function